MAVTPLLYKPWQLPLCRSMPIVRFMGKRQKYPAKDKDMPGDLCAAGLLFTHWADC